MGVEKEIKPSSKKSTGLTPSTLNPSSRPTTEIDQLKKQIEELKKENEHLKKQIEELKVGKGEYMAEHLQIKPATLVESFQSELLRAHQFALSQRLPTTYVVPDVSIQLKTIVSKRKTDQGEEVVFTFPQLKEVEPDKISIISITLKPVPQPPVVEPVTGSHPVECIEEVGPVLADKLRNAGINKVRDLASLSPEQLTKLGFSQEKASKLIDASISVLKRNLSEIKDLSDEVAVVLIKMGVDSKEKLAQLDPKDLYENLRKVLKDKSPSLEIVQKLVETAKKIIIAK
ncbi:MAG: DUF4332 domain-containing protein [Thermoproteota archaeon]|nr:DUF4332 domain-containing protein [Candidatus Bathyarchaeota archaeon]